MPSPLSMFRSLSMGARRADAPSVAPSAHGGSPAATRFLDRLVTRASSACRRASVRLRPRFTQSKPVHFQELQLLMHDWELRSPEKRRAKAATLLKTIDRYIAFMREHPDRPLANERVQTVEDWREAVAEPLGRAFSSIALTTQTLPLPPLRLPPRLLLPTRGPSPVAQHAAQQEPVNASAPSDQPPYTSTDRERHVRALMAAVRDIHPPVERGDYAVATASQRVVYRLWPMSDRASAAETSAKARAMATASAMLESITAQTGLSLGLPRATYAQPVSRKFVPVVVADEVSGRAPVKAASADKLLSALTGARARQLATAEALTLQQLLIGHWLMGRPNPTWADLKRDEQGQLRARELSPHTGALSEVWREAVNHGPSELFMTPDRKSLSAMACQPLDPSLREQLLKIDLRKVEVTMTGMTQRLEEASDIALTSRRAVADRLAPLSALQEVLRNPASKDLPLEMLMVDVGDRLRVIDRKASAAEDGR